MSGSENELIPPGGTSRALVRVPKPELVAASGEAKHSGMPDEKLFEVRLLAAVFDALQEDNIEHHDSLGPYDFRKNETEFPVWKKELFFKAPEKETPDLPGAVAVYVHNPDRLEKLRVRANLQSNLGLRDDSTITVEVTTDYVSRNVDPYEDKNPGKRVRKLPGGDLLMEDIPLGSESSTELQGANRGGNKCGVPDMVERLMRDKMIPEGFNVVGYETHYCPDEAIKINTSSYRIGGSVGEYDKNGMSVTWSLEVNRKDLPRLREHLASMLHEQMQPDPQRKSLLSAPAPRLGGSSVGPT